MRWTSLLLPLVALSFAPASSTARPGAEGVAATPTVAWSDFDRDGRPDALVVGVDGLAVRRNTGARGLEDRSASLGLSELGPVAGAGWIDFDRDGWVDLALLDGRGVPRLLRNDLGLAFVDVTLARGLDDEPALALEWLDANGDRRPDLVTSHADRVRLWTQEDDGAFVPVEIERAPPLLAGPLASAADDRRAVAGGATAERGAPVDPVDPIDPIDPGDRAVPGLRSESAGVRTLAGPSAGTSATTTLAGGASSASALPGAELWPGCVDALADQAGGPCLQATTVPGTLGVLYPQSLALNVDASERVGVGRFGALAKLHAQAQGTETALRADADGRAAFLLSTDPAAPTVEVRSGGYAGFFGGRLDVGYVAGSPLLVNEPRAALDVDTTNAGLVSLRNDAERETVRISAEPSTSPGAEIALAASSGGETFEVLSEGALGRGSTLRMRHPDATQTVYLTSDFSSAGGAALYLHGGNGQGGVVLQGNETVGNGGIVKLYKPDGTQTITLDADYGGSGRIRTEVLEITGGADLAESFETGADECPPGSVVVIDPDRPGELRLSTEPYDPRVAGIVSGAGGIRPGLEMGQEGVASGSTPVALTGRVWVQATSENGPIEAGDLLTSAATPGHAMRASDRERAFGSVLGKAMTSLEDGTGLVLVLVSLQ